MDRTKDLHNDSTGQAETYAFFNLLKEVIWERNLLRELGFPQQEPTNCYSDNDGVVIQSTKVVNHASAKHYRIAQAFIRQVCADGIAKATPIHTSLNPSDIGTKPSLSASTFQRHACVICHGSPTELHLLVVTFDEGKCWNNPFIQVTFIH
jgi:hypothetical protein